jgi:hypothetical protein
MIFAKAIAGAVAGLLGALAAQLEVAGSFGSVSDLGWVLAVSAALAGFTAVYFTPNKAS